MRRVVITGAGIWSCLGTDLDTVAQALREGRSGIGVDLDRIKYGYQSPLTGIVQKPNLKGLLDRRLRVSFAEQAEYAYMASSEAFAMSGIDAQYIKDNEIGVIFGNDSCAKPVIETARIMDELHDSTMVGRALVFQSMNSTVTMNLSSAFGLRGVNFTVSAACASGSHSIGLAYMMIRQGVQDIVLAGGAQETNYFSMASFDAINAFSMRTASPTEASRPFDKNRDGLVPSGGAAALVLEDYDHAVARGAKIMAEVIGYGVSSNGDGGISNPNEKGSYLAMRRALADACIAPSDVDYINAHATSTPQGDMIEAKALKELFGNERAWISSTKSMTGHECWMAGASEIVYSLLMMRDNFIAPNINFSEPDEYSDGLHLATHTIDTPVNVVLSNSFGFGGTNSALVIKKE